MEQPNKLDDLMRLRLRHTEVPPPAFVWPNVEKALRKRKRRFLIWLFVGSLTVGLLGAGLWAFYRQIEPATPLPLAPQSVALPGNNPPEASTPVSTSPAQTATLVAALAGTTTAHSGKVHSYLPRIRTSGYTASETPAPDSRPVASVSGHANGLDAARQDAAYGLLPVNQSPFLVQPETGAVPPTTSEPAITPTTETGTTGLPLPAVILVAPSVRSPLMKPIMLPPAKAKKAPRKCYDFHSHPQALLLDAYVGPSWAAKHLTTTDSEQQDYLADRERTESRDFGLNAGVRASYLFGGNFLLRTGLNLDHFEERFEHIDPNYIQYDIRVIQKFINGQWISVTDTLGILYGTNYLKTYNRFTLLDIPLQVALELRSGATGVSLNLGGSINVLFEKRGSILHPDDYPVSFTPGTGQLEVFRTSLGVSLLGSIQWFYHVSPRTRLFAEPYYRHIIDPVTRPELKYEQSYGIAGLRLGVTQIFN